MMEHLIRVLRVRGAGEASDRGGWLALYPDLPSAGEIPTAGTTVRRGKVMNFSTAEEYQFMRQTELERMLVNSGIRVQIWLRRNEQFRLSGWRKQWKLSPIVRFAG